MLGNGTEYLLNSSSHPFQTAYKVFDFVGSFFIRPEIERGDLVIKTFFKVLIN